MDQVDAAVDRLAGEAHLMVEERKAASARRAGPFALYHLVRRRQRRLPTWQSARPGEPPSTTRIATPSRSAVVSLWNAVAAACYSAPLYGTAHQGCWRNSGLISGSCTLGDA